MEALIIFVVVVCGVIAIRLQFKLHRIRTTPKPKQYEIVDTCVRCGATRTSIVENLVFADEPIMRGGVVRRIYTYDAHPPTTDGFTVCRGTGTHQWGERRTRTLA